MVNFVDLHLLYSKAFPPEKQEHCYGSIKGRVPGAYFPPHHNASFNVSELDEMRTDDSIMPDAIKGILIPRGHKQIKLADLPVGGGSFKLGERKEILGRLKEAYEFCGKEWSDPSDKTLYDFLHDSIPKEWFIHPAPLQFNDLLEAVKSGEKIQLTGINDLAKDELIK